MKSAKNIKQHYSLQNIPLPGFCITIVYARLRLHMDPSKWGILRGDYECCQETKMYRYFSHLRMKGGDKSRGGEDETMRKGQIRAICTT